MGFVDHWKATSSPGDGRHLAVIPWGGRRYLRASFRTSLESQLLQTESQGSPGSQPDAWSAPTRGVQHRPGGPTSSSPLREPIGRTMPSADTALHQLGALQSGVQDTGRSFAHSILGRLKPERCYCSSTGETRHAKPRQHAIAVCLHPSCRLQQTAWAKSPWTNSALRWLFFQGTQRKKLLAKGSLNLLQNHFKESYLSFLKTEREHEKPHRHTN